MFIKICCCFFPERPWAATVNDIAYVFVCQINIFSWLAATSDRGGEGVSAGSPAPFALRTKPFLLAGIVH